MEDEDACTLREAIPARHVGKALRRRTGERKESWESSEGQEGGAREEQRRRRREKKAEEAQDNM